MIDLKVLFCFGRTGKQPIRSLVEEYIFLQLLIKSCSMNGPNLGHVVSSSLTISYFNVLFLDVAY